MARKKIFISLNNRDNGLAEALKFALDSIFGEAFEVFFSTSKELESGISPGENWFQWIVDKVVECDKAFVLVTTNSVQAPWLMWESGAVFGAAMSSGESGYDKVWPIIFQLKSDEIPSPINDSKAQRLYGDRQGDVKRMIFKLFDEYKNELKSNVTEKLGEVNSILEEYIKKVRAELLNAPALPTETVLAEWRKRVRDLAEDNRASEAKQLQHWMEVAFGRDKDKPFPVDLGIHVRLGELYANNLDYENAIQQYELAQRLGSRDILILRRLGKAYLEAKRLDEAKQVIDRIEELDAKAYVNNAECAALLGRYHRQSGDLRKAAESYSTALNSDPQSYYLANLTAEIYLELGDREKANSFFLQAIKIIDEEILDKNIWTLATKSNAYMALGELDKSRNFIAQIPEYEPSQDNIETISEGLEKIAKHLDPKPDLQPLLDLLIK